MPIKGEGLTQIEVTDEFDGGFSWIAHPDERLRRTSHALFDAAGVWLVDPVEGDDLDERLAATDRPVAGVVVLLDRHLRDAATLANRYDVAVHRPPWMGTIDADLNCPTRPMGRVAGYESHRRLDLPFWKEAVLYHPDHHTLIVPESVGTVPFFRSGDEPVGVHPALRLFPPRDLLQFSPKRLLVGHGAGVHENATDALHDTIRNSWRRSPRLFVDMVRRTLS